LANQDLDKTHKAPKQENNEILQDFDLEKLLRIFLVSIPWILILLSLPLVTAYLYLRYTPPVFLASSNIKLEIKDKNSILGIQATSTIEDDIYGEIEFIRSDIIYEAVVDKTELWVTYYAQGQILDSERYKNSPFRVKYKIIDESFYEKQFFIRIINKQSFELSFYLGEVEFRKKYKFGQKIRTQGFEMIIQPTENLKTEIAQYFYFKIHTRNSIINYIRNSLIVDVVNPNAKIISISFKESNPKKAADLVNIIDSVYLEKSLAEKNKSNRQQLQYLDEQLKNIQEQLKIYEEKIADFILENKTRNVEGKIEGALEKVEELATEKAELQEKLGEVRELEAYIYQEESLPIPPLYNHFEALAGYINELNELKKQREEVLYYKKETTYSVQRINKEIVFVEENLQKMVARLKKELFERIQEINKAIFEIQKDFSELPERSNEYRRINRLYQIYENYYLKMLDRQAEIGVAGAGIIPEFVILSPAGVPSVPISPQKPTIYGVAAVVGLFLSFLLVGVRYLLSNSINTQKELERVVNVPILGIVPKTRRVRKSIYSKLVVKEGSKASLDEALRSIRANLDFLIPQKQKDTKQANIISVTSTISGEGKTFVVVNTGGIIAISSKKVVVLDLDLRKPKVHLAFGKMEDENSRGISTILIGQHHWKECIRPSAIDNLDYISSGPNPPNPSELILQESFDNLLKDLGQEYDIILIDTPPVGIVVDAMLIMQKVDVPLYVFRAGVSKRHFAKNANRLFTQNFPKLAIILNDVRINKSYGYGYGNYGGGGYYEENDADKSLLFKLLSVLKRKK